MLQPPGRAVSVRAGVKLLLSIAVWLLEHAGQAAGPAARARRPAFLFDLILPEGCIHNEVMTSCFLVSRADLAQWQARTAADA
jgi:hypothetical protein